jgi:NTP pyrophosphatase (non-canonical NTP hydrolase)
MNLKTLIEKIERVSANYSKKFKIPRNKLWYLLKVQEEMGELTQAYLSMSGQGRHKNKTAEELKSDFEHEIADVLCHVLLLAQSEGVDLKKAIDEKWLKRLEPAKIG